jgi:hypothetical protein
MRIYILLFFTVFLIACSGNSETSNTASNTTTRNANGASSNAANNPLATTKQPEAATSNNAPTLAPVVQNYYAALQKKDETAAKKILSQSAIKYWDDEAKAEKKTGFAYLLEAEEPLAEKREIRNEKIEGDAATAEIKGGSLGVWTPIKFVRENGEWKFASPKDSLESLQNIPRTAAGSNQAK